MGGSSRPVTVTCPNHHQALASGLWNFFTTLQGTDLEVPCGTYGQPVRAHRVVVEVFLSANKLCETALGLNDHQLDINIHSLLEFMYNGSVTVPEERLAAVHRLARQLDFQILADAVQASMTDTGDISACSTRETSICQATQTQEVTRRSPVFRLVDAIGEDHSSNDCLSAVDAVETGSRAVIGRRHHQRFAVKPIGIAKRRSQRRTVDSDAEQVTAPVKLKLRLTKARAEQWSRRNDDVTSGGDDVTSSTSDVTPPRAGHLRRKRKPPGAASKSSSVAADDTGTVSPGCDRKQPLFSCEQCDFSTKLKYRYLIHVAQHDPARTVLFCRYCSKAFLCRKAYESHQVRHTPNRCSHCPFETMRRQQFYQHLYTVHRLNAHGKTVVDSIQCPDCSFKCNRKSKLRSHAQAKHSGLKPFKCESCSYAFSRKADLQRHVRLLHSGIRREPSCMCEQCGQRCYTPYDLKIHKRGVHKNERPYTCETCGHTFKYRSAFRTHQRSHSTNKKPFICHLCGIGCTRPENLRGHIQNVHKSETEQETTRPT